MFFGVKFIDQPHIAWPAVEQKHHDKDDIQLQCDR